MHTKVGHLLNSVQSLIQPTFGAVDCFFFWAVRSLLHGQVFVTDPVKEMDYENMQQLIGEFVKACDMGWMNGVDGEYMFRSERNVTVFWKNEALEIFGVAKSEELEDEKISEKIGVLRAFVMSHFNELIIIEHRFHFE
jgi:hypothetical protein